MLLKNQRSILIVDDCEEDRQTYCRYLCRDSHCTYKIVEAETGEEGLLLCQQQVFDAILLDYLLPDLDGLEFFNQLKVKFLDIPVLMLTGTGNESVAIEALKSGVRDYLIKGAITAESLRIAINSAIEQQRWQRIAQANDERFRASVETMLDCFGIYTTIRNASGSIIDFHTDYLNAAACKNNISREKEPKTCQLSSFNLKDELFADCCYVVETGQSLSKEIALNKLDTTCFYDLKISRLNDGFVAIWRDISDRKQAERSLKESEKRFRILVDRSPVGIFQTDARGNCVFVNLCWESLTGLSVREAIGNGWIKALHPDDVKRMCSVWYESMRMGNEFALEYRFRTPEGKVNWVFGQATAIYDDAGTCTGYFGTITDINARKEAEILLARQNDKLREINRDLSTTTTLLEKRNRELDDFAHIVSHDLKAPLRGIKNLSQWIEEDVGEKLDEATLKQLELLRGRVGHMEKLISAILEYSQAGRKKSSSQSICVKSLLEQVIDSIAPPPEFTIEIAEGMPQLITEVIPLQQVFANLISNAIQHHDRPDGLVKITAIERDNFYEFAISDNGPGIAREDRDRIFQIFQTLDKQRAIDSDSTGIGLAIVKKLVESQGGKIEVESEIDRGSTFRFSWKK